MENSMYTVALKGRMEAEHYLPDNDKADERMRHRHDYGITVQLEGETLDQQGFLLDIDDVGRQLEQVLSQFRGKLLNDIGEFRGLPPSIEQLARLLCIRFRQRVTASNIRAVSLTVAENGDACASYREETTCVPD
jgi:6-pyruvoyltetrahydropterin/6-carboxytetrahydropterin synthase